MPSNTLRVVRNSLTSFVLPLLLAALSGCCCYDPCGYYGNCYNPCGGGGYYTSGMNYGSCVNDLPTLYGMQNGYCAPINCAPINTCSTVSRAPMVMRTYSPPPMNGGCFTGGCDVGGGCEYGECTGDYCQDGVIYETPEPTMGMPYGNYAYHERYHQHHNKVSWTQKFKAGWKKKFGKKPCDCPRCREKRRHFKNGEVHALNCGCPICRGDQYAMASSYEGEVMDGDVVYEDGEVIDGDAGNGEVIYEQGDVGKDGSHIVQPGHNPQTCPHCQKAAAGVHRSQMTYEAAPTESLTIEQEPAQNNGMTQPYPEYGGQHFAPPVPSRDGNGAKLNGQIMEGAAPADANPEPTFRQRPTTDDAPMPQHNPNMQPPVKEEEFSQPRPIPDGNVSLKPPISYTEELMLPPTWDDAQASMPTSTPKVMPATQALTPPPIPASTEYQWARSAPAVPLPAPKATDTAVYAQPVTTPARPTMDDRYRTTETKTTKPASHEQPTLLPPAPGARK